MAKYHEWITENGLLAIEAFAFDGLTDEQIAAKMGIGTTTLYEWRNRFPEIAEALKKGKAPVDRKVENALLKRALGYDYEETTTELYTDGKKHVKKITRHVPADVTAIIYWLKNRKPAYWRDRPVEPDTADDPLKAYLESFKNAADK